MAYTARNYNQIYHHQRNRPGGIFATRIFLRRFKKCMGVTFLEYQNELRLSYIYRDLITTRDPVHDILERHGFTNL